jgi:hypothetical protein
VNIDVSGWPPATSKIVERRRPIAKQLISRVSVEFHSMVGAHSSNARYLTIQVGRGGIGTGTVEVRSGDTRTAWIRVGDIGGSKLLRTLSTP